MIRLAALFFLLYAMVGVYAPWLPPLLASYGIAEADIGLALSVVAATRAILPPLWGLIADRVGSKRTILAVSATIAGAAITLTIIPWRFEPMLLVLFFFAFFMVPVPPFAEVLTLAALGARRALYGRVRLWGSIGFIATSVGVGFAVRQFGLGVIPIAAGLPLMLCGLIAAGAPEAPSAASVAWRSAVRALPWRRLALVLGAASLGQASHGPYYAYFSLQMADRGVSTPVIGGLWAIGVIAEIILMAVSARFLPRIGLGTGMRWALALSALRWAMLAAEPSLAIVAISQVLHAASFALLHLSSVQLVDDLSPTHSKALGQTLFSAVVYGAGVGGGLAIAGQLIGSIGYEGLYTLGGIVCVAAYAVALLATRGGDPIPARASG